MSSELLRIHDENNNCDLVAVANPMGNFHLSTYAEMQDGTQKPVDGWYLFSKMIEKLGQGGSSGGGVVIIEISQETGEPSIPRNEIDSLVRSGVMVLAKIGEATIPMVCDGVGGKMEFFGLVGAGFSDDGKLNYADAYDAMWDDLTNKFIVTAGWSEFGA